MKKKWLILAAVLICLAVLGAGTYANFTTSYQVHNVITTSGVEIELEEWADQVGGTEYPTEEVPVMPSSVVTKIPTVKAKAISAPAWIRAKVVVKVDGRALTETQAARLVLMDMNTTHWTSSQGWWYYNQSLSANQRTEPLFTQVTFSGPNFTNEYKGKTITVDVFAQGVQTANNGSSAMTAAGWPG